MPLPEDTLDSFGYLCLGKPKPTNTPEPSTPLPASLQQLADKLVGDASRTRIIISGRRGGRSAVMAEIAKQIRSEPALRKVFLGGTTVPCPWERKGGRETFYPATNDSSKQAADDAASKMYRQREREIDALRYALETATKEKESKKPSVDLKPRHEVDRLRTADILQAMIMRNATDWAIPEEWMDELSDLIWRERDRLGGNTKD